MEYLGYRAKVEFDGKIFFGTIDNISDLVTFETDNAESLEREFHDAVDEYIEFRKLTHKGTENFATAV